MSAFVRIDSPYTRLEAFAYDRWFAPIVERLRRERQAEFLPRLSPGASILDVGCGGGHLAAGVAREHPDARVTGLDLSADQVRRASRRTAGLGGRCRFVRGSATALPFADGAFDGVLSVGCLKHWPDRPGGMREIVRVLRPGAPYLVLELDRGCRLEEARSFIGGLGVPRAVRPIVLALFRTYVAGASVDLDDARALLAGLPGASGAARRVDGLPGLILEGRRDGGGERV